MGDQERKNTAGRPPDWVRMAWMERYGRDYRRDRWSDAFLHQLSHCKDDASRQILVAAMRCTAPKTEHRNGRITRKTSQVPRIVALRRSPRPVTLADLPADYANDQRVRRMIRLSERIGA